MIRCPYTFDKVGYNDIPADRFNITIITIILVSGLRHTEGWFIRRTQLLLPDTIVLHYVHVSQTVSEYTTTITGVQETERSLTPNT